MKLKKGGRRILGLVLAVLMVCTIVPSSIIASAVSADDTAEQKEVYCGKTEHTHSEDCISEELICDQEEELELVCELEEHEHDDDCYDKELICDKAHEHDEDCYEWLVDCDNENHEKEEDHDAECYTKTLVCGDGHNHDEDCYVVDEDKLVCENEDADHKHTSDCYGKKLFCTKSHEHDDDCYKKTLKCETKEHKHTKDCYKVKESSPHKHTADCYKQVYNCDGSGKELEEHTHTEQCYSKEGSDEESEDGESEDEESDSSKSEESTPEEKEKVEQIKDSASKIFKDANESNDQGHQETDANKMVSNVKITNVTTGKEVKPGSAVVNTTDTYKIDITIKENPKVGGATFADEMVYTLPEGISIDPKYPISGGIKHPTKDFDVATFTVEGNTVKIKFLPVDDEGKPSQQTWNHVAQNEILNFSFYGKFVPDGEGGKIKIPFGDDYEIEIDVRVGGSIVVQKSITSGNTILYDEAAQKYYLTYQVVVTADGAFDSANLVDVMKLTATPNSGGASVDVGVEIKDIEITTKDAKGQQTSNVPGEVKGGKIQLGPIESGGQKIITYKYYFIKQGSEYSGDYSYQLTENNTATVHAYNGKEEVTGSSSTSTDQLKMSEFSKTGWVTNRVVDGKNVRLIYWTVTLGDGTWNVGGVELEDTLGRGLEVYRPTDKDAKSYQPRYTTWTENLKSSQTIYDNNIDITNITVPNGAFKYQLSYYTTYTDWLIQNDTVSAVFTNTVKDKTHHWEITSGGVRGSIGIPPGAPTKTTLASNYEYDGKEYIKYQIDFNVPKDWEGGTGPTLEDVLQEGILPTTSGDTTKYSITNVPNSDLLKVYIVKNKGTDQEQVEEYTNWKWASGSNNTSNIVFGIDPSTGYSTLGDLQAHAKWEFDVAVDIRVVYCVGRDMTVVDGPDKGKTIDQILAEGKIVHNKARFYMQGHYSNYSNITQLREQVGYEMDKAARSVDTENKTITYQVRFTPDQAGTYDVVFKDVYDKQLEYKASNFDFKVEATYNKKHSNQADWGKVCATYTGGAVVDEATHSFTARTTDIKNGGTTLSSSFRRDCDYYFIYTLNVPDDIIQEAMKKEWTNVQFDNDAEVYWPESGTKIVFTSASVDYPTGTLVKKGERDKDNPHRINYTITFNSARKEFGADKGEEAPKTLVLTDKIESDNLLINGSSVKAYEVKEDGTRVELPEGTYKRLSAESMQFTVPNKTAIEIVYSCDAVTQEKESLNFQAKNSVSLEGYAEVTTTTDSRFRVSQSESSSAGSVGTLHIFKEDDLGQPIQGAKFMIYTNHTNDPTVVSQDDYVEYDPTGSGNAVRFAAMMDPITKEPVVLTTDSNGGATFTHMTISPGTDDYYMIREIETPYGYMTWDEMAAAGKYVGAGFVPNLNFNAGGTGGAIVFEFGFVDASSGRQRVFNDGTIYLFDSIGNTDIPVRKVWDDDHNYYGHRPKEVIARLYANDVATDSIVRLNSENSWKNTFKDLPLLDSNKQKITYTVKEEGTVTHYLDPVVEEDEKNPGGYKITNKIDVAKTEVEVTKAWNDGENSWGRRPDKITVQLYADGEIVKDKTLELSDQNNWTAKFVDLPAEKEGGDLIEYTVKEETLGSYRTVITGDQKEGFKITNTLKTDISVSKQWKDADDLFKVRAEDIEVELYKNGTATGEKLTLNESNDWLGKFENLDLYDDEGNFIEYTVQESTLPEKYTATQIGSVQEGGITIVNTFNYNLPVQKAWSDFDNYYGTRPAEVQVQLYANDEEVQGQVVSLNEENNWQSEFVNLPVEDENGVALVYTVKEIGEYPGYKVEIKGDMKTGFQITNTYTELINIPVEKSWNDDNDHFGGRPNKVEFQLLANGMPLDKTVVLTKNGNWKGEFKNLPRLAPDGTEINYSVQEINVPDKYIAGEAKGNKNAGFTIENTYSTTAIDVNVEKVWDDNNNKDGARPKEVVIRLYADGEDTGKVLTLSEDNNWKGKFEGLANSKDNVDIQYTIKEDSVNGYESTIESTSYGFTVTNKRTSTGGGGVSPKTGDNSNIYVWVAIVPAAAAALAAVLIIVLVRRNRNKKK